jgi:DNA-binding NarL/FixJ family response regulator
VSELAGEPAAEPRIRILLVDDHAVVREGLRELLGFEPDLEVVGEAADAQEALEQAVRLRPDVVVLDVEIPHGEAPDTVQAIRAACPQTRILILSMYDGPQLLSRLLSVGISGYLLKSVNRRELVSAIRSVHLFPDRLVLSISRNSVPRLPGRETEVELSPRELEILELVSRALSNGQVASRLNITEATVKRHLRNVFEKLGAVSRIDAVNKAAARSLITPPTDRRPG